jgi:hypothetical protein
MNEVSDEVFWKETFKKHWMVLTLCIIVGIILFLSFFVVLALYVNTSPIGGYGTWTIDVFSLGTALQFCIQLMLLELLLIFLPGGVFFIIVIYLWYKKLPEDEKAEFKRREDKSKSRKRKTQQYGGGGGGSFIITIIFFIIVGLGDGNWLTPFGSLPISYFINAYLLAISWCLIIFGIPICIAIIAWLLYKK